MADSRVKEEVKILDLEEVKEAITKPLLDSEVDNIEEITSVTKELIELTVPTVNKVAANLKEDRKTKAVYPYVDENGELLYEILRRKGDGNPYLVRSYDLKGKEMYKLPEGIKLVPYNLPEVIKAIKNKQIIWITEGESKVEDLRKLGFVGTTCAFAGPEKWNERYSEFLRGAKGIVVIQDNDFNGERFAENTLESLVNALDKEEVSILKLSDICSSLKEGGDIEDLIKVAGFENVKLTLETYANNFTAE